MGVFKVVHGLEDRVDLSGNVLYGDDFGCSDLEQWFAEEREGYSNLSGHGAASSTETGYGYEALARQHAFRWLPPRRFRHVLGIGSAHGAELMSVLARAERVTVLEPSDGFATKAIAGTPVEYVKPEPSGAMPFENEEFDLILCFGVLHHIPNVSTVLGEMSRVLRQGGYALLREPTISMGDWRESRPGLTKNERGIPLALFRDSIRRCGFEVIRETRCMFSLTAHLGPVIKRSVWTVDVLVRLDALVCRLPIWSGKYHPTRPLDKLRPTSVAYVLGKRSAC